MKELAFTMLFLVLFFVLMAIGHIIKRKALKGSCGGLGAIMGEDCMFCDKKEECDKKKKMQSLA